MKEPLMIFVDTTQTIKRKISWGWYVVWFLAAVIYLIWIIRPDYQIVPPFIHDIKVTM